MKCFVYIFANTHPQHDNKILLLNLSHDNTKPSKYFLHNTENVFMTNTSTTQGNPHNFFQQHREFLHDNINSTLEKKKKNTLFLNKQLIILQITLQFCQANNIYSCNYVLKKSQPKFLNAFQTSGMASRPESQFIPYLI